ncbi:MAG: heavy-metal-associated domain-containing protein [Lachnospiraceae bacterium]|nr:heavy-metal-associated domain-containing protein [Lachnospiraceae bacterium]
MYKTTASVDGMMCDMCESHINEMIRKKFNVKKVSSSHKKNETVIISESPITKDELEAGLSEMGYHCIDAKSEEYTKKGLFGLGR